MAKEITFMYSAFGPEQFPTPTLPEVAFAGRSNVGKSSLLNSLLGAKQLAKVSSTPGRTRSINFFLIDKHFLFADLPGYGFARVPASVQRQWRGLIDAYLNERQSLAGVMLLVDSRHPPHASDLQLAAFLSDKEVPFLLVATKIDKVARSKQKAHVATLAAGFGLEADDVLAVSSVNGDGIPALWEQIRQVVAGTEGWLKAREIWGVPSLKGPKAAVDKRSQPRKKKAVEPADVVEEVKPSGPKLTPLHPDFYKQKYKRPKTKKKGGKRR